MKNPKKWSVVGCAASAAVLMAVAADPAVVGAATKAGTATRIAYGGNAFGSSATVGTLVRSGQTALVPLCNTTRGLTYSDRSAAVDLGPAGTIGAATTRVSSSRAGTQVASTSTTHTAKSALLNGLITFDAVSTEARMALRGSTFLPSGRTTVTALRIGGRTYAADPTANQTVTLPGIGSLVLNQQARHAGQGLHSMATIALHLVVTPSNALHLPATNIVVGQSYASLHTPTYRQPHGYAYGTAVQVGSTLSSGRTAPAVLPCGGSSGVTRVNTTAGVNLPGTLTTGAVTSTARSIDNASATTAVTSNRIGDVDLLGGMITVHAITTKAAAKRTGTRLAISALGTQVLGLSIGGKAVSSPRAGTTRTISGLGTLRFGSVLRSRTGLTVYALQLVLSNAHGSLPAGAVITVGAAQATVQP